MRGKSLGKNSPAQTTHSSPQGILCIPSTSRADFFQLKSAAATRLEIKAAQYLFIMTEKGGMDCGYNKPSRVYYSLKGKASRMHKDKLALLTYSLLF